MEASDPFATAAPADEKDPFEEIEAEQATSAAEADEPTLPPEADETAEEPPIVNREGERLEGEQPQEGAPGDAPAEAASAPPEQPEETAAAEEPEAASEAPQETAPPARQPAAVRAGRATQTQPEGDGGEQEPPAEPETVKGEMRRYKLLYQTGPNQWTEAPLGEVPPDSSIRVETDEESGEFWLMARNADHARRLAWTIFGRPENGVRVSAIAGSGWKPKLVRQAPPKPDRERLEIS